MAKVKARKDLFPRSSQPVSYERAKSDELRSLSGEHSHMCSMLEARRAENAEANVEREFVQNGEGGQLKKRTGSK